jgi:hypothetical protein
MQKIHLNHSGQDPSYLCEFVGNELFRTAKMPAPHVAYANVTLNGRKLGLYVLVEGISDNFLRRNFTNHDGSLYEGQNQDINEELERDGGPKLSDRSDLEALVKAAQEPDLTNRINRLREVLDVDRFLSFIAMEMMLVHFDGYCLGKNNYRIYCDTASNHFVFIPHGMDILFKDPYQPFFPEMKGLLAKSILETSEGKRLYQEHFHLLYTNALNLERINNQIEQVCAIIRPVLQDHDPALAEKQQQAAQDLLKRIKQRVEIIAEQIAYLNSGSRKPQSPR